MDSQDKRIRANPTPIRTCPLAKPSTQQIIDEHANCTANRLNEQTEEAMYKSKNLEVSPELHKVTQLAHQAAGTGLLAN